MRILIAAENQESAGTLETALHGLGYEVVVVADGHEAQRLLNSANPPRLAIVEWMLPGQDGFDVCRKVRWSGGPYIHIIMVMPSVQAAKVLTGIDTGVSDYIHRPFTPEELQARVALGLRIVELEDRAASQGIVDPLTGLLSRGAVMDRCRIELQRAAREGSVVSLALADLDDFKRINDTHGHPAGDAALREVAARSSRWLRPYDLIGRYGGEEFLFVFPKCDLLGAAAIAERLRLFISAEPIDVGPAKVTVTMSVGITASWGASKDAAVLIDEADAALFQAKKLGRDRVQLNVER